MGFYTKMHLDMVLKPDAPPEVLEWVQHFLYAGKHTYHMATAEEQAKGLGPYVNECACKEAEPPDVFWNCHRWDRLLSWGHGKEHRLFEKVERSEVRLYDGIHVKTFTELKNYDRELERFVSWILPHAQPQKDPFAVTETEDHFEVNYFADGKIVTTTRSHYDDSETTLPCPDYLESILNPTVYPKRF